MSRMGFVKKNDFKLYLRVREDVREKKREKKI